MNSFFRRENADKKRKEERSLYNQLLLYTLLSILMVSLNSISILK